MATPENTFIGSVHRHLPVSLYRMKNHNQYNGGIADAWYSGPKSDLWIEYKFVKIPKRGSTPVVIDLSDLQKEWLKCRHEEGRNVGVIVGSVKGGVWMPGVSWQAAYTAETFTAKVLSRQVLASMIGDLTSK